MSTKLGWNHCTQNLFQDHWEQKNIISISYSALPFWQYVDRQLQRKNTEKHFAAATQDCPDHKQFLCCIPSKYSGQGK